MGQRDNPRRKYKPINKTKKMKTIMEKQITHKVVLNHSKKTLTIKAYENNKLYATYRQDYCSNALIAGAEDWTESDIRSFLRYSQSYYSVD